MSPVVSFATPPRTSGASSRTNTGYTGPRPGLRGALLRLYFHSAELAFARFTSSKATDMIAAIITSKLPLVLWPLCALRLWIWLCFCNKDIKIQQTQGVFLPVVRHFNLPHRLFPLFFLAVERQICPACKMHGGNMIFETESHYNEYCLFRLTFTSSETSVYARYRLSRYRWVTYLKRKQPTDQRGTTTVLLQGSECNDAFRWFDLCRV